MYTHLNYVVGGGFSDGKENRSSRDARSRHLNLPRAAASLVPHHSLRDNKNHFTINKMIRCGAGKHSTGLDTCGGAIAGDDKEGGGGGAPDGP